MAAIQGTGKVRLIAKQGRFRDDASTRRARELMEIARGNFSDPKAQQDAAQFRREANNLLVNGGKGGLENYYIEFDVTPEITEQGSVSYFEAGEIRGPGSILMYMGSPSRTFSLNASLVSRNSAEARKAERQIHILKSWRMPESYTGGINAGTPTLLYLQGYGKMFRDIPVVMTDLSIEFPSEHDYISTGTSSSADYYQQLETSRAFNPDWSIDETKTQSVNHKMPNKSYASAVPIITKISMTLKEAHSVEGEVDGLEGFDILQYRNGKLHSW